MVVVVVLVVVVGAMTKTENQLLELTKEINHLTQNERLRWIKYKNGYKCKFGQCYLETYNDGIRILNQKKTHVFDLGVNTETRQFIASILYHINK